MTQEEQKKLLIEASRRYPEGTEYRFPSWKTTEISSGTFRLVNDYSVADAKTSLIIYDGFGDGDGWATVVSTPKKPFNWKKALAWVILIAIGMPVIYLIHRSGFALSSGKGFTGWFLYLGVVAALSGWPLVIWWAIENIR